MRKLFFLCMPLLMAAYPALAQNEPVKVTDMLKIKTIGDLTLSPDGKNLAFTVKEIEPDPASKWDYKYVNHIYLMPADGSAKPRQLTVKEGASQPAWSPDGRRLAFVRTSEGKAQVFLLSLDGGEPIQLTHFRYGAGTPKWSPDGNSILFSSNISLKDLLRDSILNPEKKLPVWPAETVADPHNELLRANTAKIDPDGGIDEIRAYLNNDLSDKKAKLLTRLNFQDEMDVSNEIGFNQYFVLPVADPKAQPVALCHGFYRYAAADFTPDGQNVILVGNMDSTRHPDRALESSIYIVSKDGSHFRLLLGDKGKVYNSPVLSQTGKWLAYQQGDTSFTRTARLFLVPANGTGSPVAGSTPVEIPFDRSKAGLLFSPDEKYLYFTAQSNGGVPIYRVDCQTRKITRIFDYNAGAGSFDLKNRLVFVRTDVSDPFDIYAAGPAGETPKRITDFNYEWVRNKRIVQPEKFTFTNDKGQTIEYWVMKPANFIPGKKYPLLLDIHGGPTAMWGPGESSMWHEFQFFTAKGYGIVYCNPRGSGGYGEDFVRSNIEDWGKGPCSDVLTALDKTVAQGWADTARLVVSGGSYAGYLTAWIVGHDHRFKAACAQRGVYDLGTFFGEGNAWRLVPNYFAGYPWEANTRAIIQRESPITYVADITTPLIIFHGENDRRTGFVQGEMLYRSLKVLGRPVEYVRHPGGTHELTRSGDNRQRIDQMLRTYEFFERCLQRTDH